MIYRFNNCELNSDRVVLLRDGQAVAIEPQSFNVLVFLVGSRGRVVSRDELIDNIWGHEHVSDSTLSSCIKVARKAVGDDGVRQGVIRTVHGRGYEFVAALEVNDPSDQPVSKSNTNGQPSLPLALSPLIGRDEFVAKICTISGST